MKIIRISKKIIKQAGQEDVYKVEYDIIKPGYGTEHISTHVKIPVGLNPIEYIEKIKGRAAKNIQTKKLDPLNLPTEIRERMLKREKEEEERQERENRSDRPKIHRDPRDPSQRTPRSKVTVVPNAPPIKGRAYETINESDKDKGYRLWKVDVAMSIDTDKLFGVYAPDQLEAKRKALKFAAEERGAKNPSVNSAIESAERQLSEGGGAGNR